MTCCRYLTTCSSGVLTSWTTRWSCFHLWSRTSPSRRAANRTTTTCWAESMGIRIVWTRTGASTELWYLTATSCMMSTTRWSSNKTPSANDHRCTFKISRSKVETEMDYSLTRPNSTWPPLSKRADTRISKKTASHLMKTRRKRKNHTRKDKKTKVVSLSRSEETQKIIIIINEYICNHLIVLKSLW